MSFDVLELAGRSSALNLKGGYIAAYRMSSARRLCSATSPGRVAKCASSVAILERRFSTLFLTAPVACEWVRQRRTTITDRERTLESVSAAEMVLRAVLRGLNPSGGSFATSMGSVTALSAMFPAASSGTGRC